MSEIMKEIEERQARRQRFRNQVKSRKQMVHVPVRGGYLTFFREGIALGDRFMLDIFSSAPSKVTGIASTPDGFFEYQLGPLPVFLSWRQAQRAHWQAAWKADQVLAEREKGLAFEDEAGC